MVAKFNEWEQLGVVAVGPQIPHDESYGSTQIERLAKHVIPQCAPEPPIHAKRG